MIHGPLQKLLSQSRYKKWTENVFCSGSKRMVRKLDISFRTQDLIYLAFKRFRSTLKLKWLIWDAQIGIAMMRWLYEVLDFGKIWNAYSSYCPISISQWPDASTKLNPNKIITNFWILNYIQYQINLIMLIARLLFEVENPAIFMGANFGERILGKYQVIFE